MTIEETNSKKLVRLSDRARANGSRLARESMPFETGGILVGWLWGETVVIADVIAVTDAGAGRRDYIRSHSLAQHALNDYRGSSTDKNIGYVGEWHSHPAPLPPSQIDYRSIEELAQQTSHPVALVVFAVHPGGIVLPTAAIAVRHGPNITFIEAPLV